MCSWKSSKQCPAPGHRASSARTGASRWHLNTRHKEKKNQQTIQTRSAGNEGWWSRISDPPQGFWSICQCKTWHQGGLQSKKRAKPKGGAACLQGGRSTDSEMAAPSQAHSQGASLRSEQAQGQGKRDQHSGKNWAESVAAEQSSLMP